MTREQFEKEMDEYYKSKCNYLMVTAHNKRKMGQPMNADEYAATVRLLANEYQNGRCSKEKASERIISLLDKVGAK